MGDYFKPWRRKFGLFTLMVACQLMAVWMRSERPDFHLSLISTKSGHHIGLTSNGIEWGARIPETILWSYWKLPYWSIVIPLIMLSAWLLFSRPPKPKGTDFLPRTE